MVLLISCSVLIMKTRRYSHVPAANHDLNQEMHLLVARVRVRLDELRGANGRTAKHPPQRWTRLKPTHPKTHTRNV
eukprot:COSAG01_NODE_5550_length_4190_cov_48.559276_5_plen_76_part_00